MNELESKIRQEVEALIEDSSVFVVEVTIKPTNNLKVFVDGDQGVNIEFISNLNRTLRKQLDELGLFPEGDYSLEVSSPGIGKPLKLFRQYPKNVGREVLITLLDGSSVEGVLKSVSEQELVLEQLIKGQHKKDNQIKDLVLSFDKIKSTIVEIKF